MPRLPSPEELRIRLSERQRQVKGLHGDLADRRVRSELRSIAKQIQSAVGALDQESDEQACRLAVALLDVVTDRLGQLENRRGR